MCIYLCRIWRVEKIVLLKINFASFIANILSFSVGWELGSLKFSSNHSFQTPHVIHSINHNEGSFPKKILNLLLPTAWHCYGGQRWNDASTLWFLWIIPTDNSEPVGIIDSISRNFLKYLFRGDYSMNWFSPDR